MNITEQSQRAYNKWISTHDLSVQKQMRAQMQFIKTFEAGYKAALSAAPTLSAELSEVGALAVRDVCELDPDDWSDPQTVCINVDTLQRLIEERIAEAEAAPTPPEVIEGDLSYAEFDTKCVDKRWYVELKNGATGWGKTLFSAIDEAFIEEQLEPGISSEYDYVDDRK